MRFQVLPRSTIKVLIISIERSGTISLDAQIRKSWIVWPDRVRSPTTRRSLGPGVAIDGCRLRIRW
jgi:hypothetical protein